MSQKPPRKRTTTYADGARRIVWTDGAGNRHVQYLNSSDAAIVDGVKAFGIVLILIPILAVTAIVVAAFVVLFVGALLALSLRGILALTGRKVSFTRPAEQMPDRFFLALKRLWFGRAKHGPRPGSTRSGQPAVTLAPLPSDVTPSAVTEWAWSPPPGYQNPYPPPPGYQYGSLPTFAPLPHAWAPYVDPKAVARSDAAGRKPLTTPRASEPMAVRNSVPEDWARCTSCGSMCVPTSGPTACLMCKARQP